MQIAHHLTAIADAERKAIFAQEELGELVAGPRVEQNRLRPALASTEHVSVGEPSTRRDAGEARERNAALDDVGHVHVVGIEARAIERRRELDMPVHALLAQ